MDWTQVKEALTAIRTMIGSHGASRYMNDRTKELLVQQTYDHEDRLRVEFVQDPKRSSWATNNPNIILTVAFLERDKPYQGPDGGMYRFLDRKISMGWSHCESPIAEFKRREDMVSNVGLLAELIEMATPESIVQTVMTPAEVEEKKRKEHNQILGRQLYKYVEDKKPGAFLGLRKGGKERRFMIESDFIGTLEPGTLSYMHVKSYDRRGKIKDKVDFNMRLMKTHDGGSMILLVQKK